MIGHYGRTRDAHALTIIKLSLRIKNAESSIWLQALVSERQLWDRARAAPRKDKC